MDCIKHDYRIDRVTVSPMGHAMKIELYCDACMHRISTYIGPVLLTSILEIKWKKEEGADVAP